MKGLRKFVVIGIVGIVLVGVGYILLKPGEKTNGQASNGGQVIRYEKVTRGDLNLTVSADGVVQPINKVEIKSKASGQIEALNIEEGTVVEKGQLLISLDQRTAKNDYEQAKAIDRPPFCLCTVLGMQRGAGRTFCRILLNTAMRHMRSACVDMGHAKDVKEYGGIALFTDMSMMWPKLSNP